VGRCQNAVGLAHIGFITTGRRHGHALLMAPSLHVADPTRYQCQTPTGLVVPESQRLTNATGSTCDENQGLHERLSKMMFAFNADELQ
jgi:hypothetical protein